MKRSQRLTLVTVAFVGTNLAGWLTLEGCGPDNNGSDAGDSSVDQTGPDVSKADVITADVVNDTGQPDAGGVDAAEIIAFQQQYAAAFCKRMGACCYGAQLDASAPDAALGKCESLIVSTASGGVENAVGDIADPQVINSGHIVVNETAKASCLADLATVSCPQITGTEYQALAQNCNSVLSGTQAPSQPCKRTVECNNGFCEYPPADAGADASAKCVALSGANQPCDPFGNGNEQCMYRGWLGSTQLRCDIAEYEAGTCAPYGTPTFVCTPKTANGGGCGYEWECATNNCSDTCDCQPANNTFTFPFVGTCNALFPDAGLN